MKVGILGTRHVHADGLAANAERCGATLVGAHEPDATARAAWSRTPHLELDALLEASDAIIVAGTNRERVEHTIAATRAGIPVLSEKPVAADAAELERLVAEVDPALVMVALPVRFGASVRRAREAVGAGAIGTPLAARGTNHGQFPGGWFGRRADAGGGALQDHVVHLGDLLCWMLDDRATRVYARAAQVMHPDNDVEDCGIVTIDYESGCFASIDSSWSRPESFPTWGDVWLELVGTEGRILLDPMATHLGLYDDAAGKLRHVGYADDDMTLEMVRAFLAFARDRPATAPVSLAEGIHASDTVLAAYASVASGRPEPVTSR
ncbi:MAG: gfo/Idh/MocA family oxidoreductase [Thermoleophilia bacterium]|nr:gfo/Idh/MocA family oxidoreductase [Thermoleophilia bacterium]